jgi:hypothetical protein
MALKGGCCTTAARPARLGRPSGHTVPRFHCLSCLMHRAPAGEPQHRSVLPSYQSHRSIAGSLKSIDGASRGFGDTARDQAWTWTAAWTAGVSACAAPRPRGLSQVGPQWCHRLPASRGDVLSLGAWCAAEIDAAVDRPGLSIGFRRVEAFGQGWASGAPECR